MLIICVQMRPLSMTNLYLEYALRVKETEDSNRKRDSIQVGQVVVLCCSLMTLSHLQVTIKRPEKGKDGI
jgi:DNA-directed RNA polymerase subunit N (RpoN/RPB10)